MMIFHMLNNQLVSLVRKIHHRQAISFGFERHAMHAEFENLNRMDNQVL